MKEMKEMKEIITRLMGEFTVESMMGCDIEIENMPANNEDFNFAMFQQQYSTWCIQSKRLLLVDQVEPLSPQGMFISYMKAHITKYIADKRNAENKTMSYLYTSNDIEILTQQISMLTRHALYKDVADINNVDEETRKNSLDPEHVSIPIAIYTLFTILANDSVDAKSFNELFIRSWFNYYDNWMARELMFQMNGEKWKNCFEGVLLS